LVGWFSQTQPVSSQTRHFKELRDFAACLELIASRFRFLCGPQVEYFGSRQTCIVPPLIVGRFPIDHRKRSAGGVPPDEHSNVKMF
jgi:hypothetical protein